MQSRQGWIVCAEVKTGREAVEAARELNPDVALVDVSMPDINGFQVASRIYEESPNSKVVIVSGYDLRTVAAAAPQQGVWAYVMKSRLGSDLIPTVEAAIRSGHLSTSVSA